MIKRIIALTICLIMIMPFSTFAAEIPTSIEAPTSISVRGTSDGPIYVRWTEPRSVTGLYTAGETHVSGTVLYEIDYRINDGEWLFGEKQWGDTTEGLDYMVAPVKTFHGNAANRQHDANNVIEDWFNPGHFGLKSFDFANNTLYFRVRYIIEYYSEGKYKHTESRFSETAAIGKNAKSLLPAVLEAPQNVKAELKQHSDGSPYFALTWDIPASITETNKLTPVWHFVDWKIGNGKWASESGGHLYEGGSKLLVGNEEINPLDKGGIGKVDIEANTYSFRVYYQYATAPKTYVKSAFSNVVSIGTPAFYSNASSWAVQYLDEAKKLGIIPDSLMGQDMSGPITRQEFAEIAVKFYQMATGKTADPAPLNPFKDCANPEVLKALNLKITAGTGDGTTFEPNAKLLRQQMATMITNTLRACFPALQLDVAGQADFKDQKSFAKYAVTPAKFMAKYEITVGDGKGSFSPNDYCTREQAVIFLVKAYDFRNNYVYN